MNIFKKKLLKFIHPSGSGVFRCHNPKAVELVTRLTLGLSHSREHKFKHGFLDSLNPICNCGQGIETSTHFLLQCSNYSNEIRVWTLSGSIDGNILNKNNFNITETLLYGDSSLDDTNNTFIMNATMEFLIFSKRFNVQLV